MVEVIQEAAQLNSCLYRFRHLLQQSQLKYGSAVGTSRETRVHTDTMEYWEHSTWNRKTIISQSKAQNHGGKNGVLPTIHTNMFRHTHTYAETHTLLAGFSVLLAVGSGWSCLHFLDGVLLILGEWNLSFSFIVKEDRWDRWESKSSRIQKRIKQLHCFSRLLHLNVTVNEIHSHGCTGVWVRTSTHCNQKWDSKQECG